MIHGQILTLPIRFGDDDTPPTRFAIVRPNLRSTIRLVAAVRAMSTGQPDAVVDLIAAVKPLIRGWHDARDVETGDEVPFSIDDLDRIIGPEELAKLAGGIVSGGRTTEGERKN